MESVCFPLSPMPVVKHADIKIGIAEKPSNRILYLRVLPPGMNSTAKIQKIKLKYSLFLADNQQIDSLPIARQLDWLIGMEPGSGFR
ncbi:hypothetical protein HMPREF9156_00403 [Scardovia wiggsiae F0424]|uniref:Uncharacterized protein n=1 Tax=Scardovia wiggsiae F0424 TaxID=857290 RepID=J0X1C2_9BIFI|nr:hypothetical protein [Scardovia wiggsiae]EJD65639.1 hypothetical protein HMPREF9156_00403 [Scardovia wiggsiae F0424]